MVLTDQPVKQDYQETKVDRVRWAVLETVVMQAQLENKELLARLVLLASRDMPVQGENQDLKDRRDQVVNLECRELLETADREALAEDLEVRVRQVFLEYKDNKGNGVGQAGQA